MPFFEVPKSTKASEADLACARSLFEGLASKKKLVTRASISKWADQFRLLRVQGGYAAEDIQQLVSWYIKNLSKPYMPIAYSAKAFREKFIRIKEARERSGPTVQISSTATKIAKDLSRLHWPLGSKDQLPAVVQISLDNYAGFIAKLKQIKDQPATAKSVRRVIEYLLGKAPTKEHFVESWFQRIQKMIESWEDWGGDLRPMAITINHKRFDKIFSSWTIEYEGSVKRWEQIKELLNE